MYNSFMQLANFFSMNRLVLAPVFFLLYFLPDAVPAFTVPSVYILAPLFLYMEFTDFLDGFCARKYNMVSDFGKLFDPFADVLTNLTVFFTFAVSGYLPPFFFVLVLFREMSMQFVRMLAMRNGVVIAARMAGKVKTVVYIVAAGFSLLIESLVRLNSAYAFLSEETFEPLRNVLGAVNICLYALAVILSVTSFLNYLRLFRSALKQPLPENGRP